MAEERRKEDLKEVKRHAEVRERELRRAQAARLEEEKEAAERRIATLKAQSEADVSTLREQHTEELAKVRRNLEDRLAAEEERRRSQVADLEEKLEGLRVRRESESRLYGERLAELEYGRLADKKAVEEDLERRLAEAEEERSYLELRIAELQDTLEESGTVEAELREALEATRTRGNEDRQQEDEQDEEWPVDDGFQEHLEEEADAARLLAEERAADLETRLREAEEENRRRSEELKKVLEELRKVSNPEQLIRAGISLFNASEHTRTVASVSKALGLPKVHVAPGDGSDSFSKPVIAFVWGDVAWRRYVSDPTEGIEEPRVYLIGTGDAPPSDLCHHEANARMDAEGRLILGVQAR